MADYRPQDELRAEIMAHDWTRVHLEGDRREPILLSGARQLVRIGKCLCRGKQQ